MSFTFFRFRQETRESENFRFSETLAFVSRVRRPSRFALGMAQGEPCAIFMGVTVWYREDALLQIGNNELTVVPLFQKKMSQEHLDILGDYDPSDARADELVEIYHSVRKRTDHVTTLLLQLEGALSHDSCGFQATKAKELIAACYFDLERINLDGDPAASREMHHEHFVFSQLAWFLIPLLLRLGARAAAQDLFREVKIKKLRDALEDKYWQLQYPAFDR